MNSVSFCKNNPNFKNVMLAGRTDAAGPDDEILEMVDFKLIKKIVRSY